MRKNITLVYLYMLLSDLRYQAIGEQERLTLDGYRAGIRVVFKPPLDYLNWLFNTDDSTDKIIRDYGSYTIINRSIIIKSVMFIDNQGVLL